jgi:hypothetical protein
VLRADRTPTADSGAFVPLDHPASGRRYDDHRCSRRPGRAAELGPAVGHDTFDVMTRILGYGEEQVAELAAAGVLS